jgi:hypothetical protein
MKSTINCIHTHLHAEQEWRLTAAMTSAKPLFEQQQHPSAGIW